MLTNHDLEVEYDAKEAADAKRLLADHVIDGVPDLSKEQARRLVEICKRARFTPKP